MSREYNPADQRRKFLSDENSQQRANIRDDTRKAITDKFASANASKAAEYAPPQNMAKVIHLNLEKRLAAGEELSPMQRLAVANGRLIHGAPAPAEPEPKVSPGIEAINEVVELEAAIAKLPGGTAAWADAVVLLSRARLKLSGMASDDA
jgi:hypothetical protein